jgi:hypothetical protein
MIFPRKVSITPLPPPVDTFEDYGVTTPFDHLLPAIFPPLVPKHNFTINLVSNAKKLMEFVRETINSPLIKSNGDVVVAVDRYERFLTLKAKYPKEKLIPTEDIEVSPYC